MAKMAAQRKLTLENDLVEFADDVYSHCPVNQTETSLNWNRSSCSSIQTVHQFIILNHRYRRHVFLPPDFSILNQ